MELWLSVIGKKYTLATIDPYGIFDQQYLDYILYFCVYSYYLINTTYYLITI